MTQRACVLSGDQLGAASSGQLSHAQRLQNIRGAASALSQRLAEEADRIVSDPRLDWKGTALPMTAMITRFIVIYVSDSADVSWFCPAKLLKKILKNINHIVVWSKLVNLNFAKSRLPV